MQTDFWKSFALDMLIGFTLLIVGAMPAAVLHHFVPNNGLLVALAGVVFFLVAALRARPEANPLLQGLALGLGPTLPILMVPALLLRALLPIALTLSLLLLLSCICGAFARALLRLRQPVGAAVVALCLGLFGFAAWHYGVPAVVDSTTFAQVDKPAPAFTLKKLDGTPVTLASLKGHVVLLDFWATWCAPCQAEMPALLKVYQQFATDPNVVYLAVDTGWDGDTDDKVRAFITKKHFPFPVAFDPQHSAANGFHLNTIPTQVIIDRNGHMRQIATGNPDDDAKLENTLVDNIQKLLKQ
jgi:peroxiredoxin